MSRRSARAKGDDGTVLLLTLGLSVVLMLLVAVVVDVSSVVLAKRALANVADGAALAAAQQPDRAAISDGSLTSRLPLDPLLVRDVVQLYEADERGGQRGLDLQGRVDGGTTAVVEAYRTVSLPLVGWLGVSAVRLHATGRAQSPTVP